MIKSLTMFNTEQEKNYQMKKIEKKNRNEIIITKLIISFEVKKRIPLITVGIQKYLLSASESDNY